MLFPILLAKTKLLPFYITAMGEKDFQRPIKRQDGLNDYQFLYSIEGRGKFIYGGESYDIGEGGAFLFKPNVSHEYYADGDTWKTCWITFNGDSADSLFEYLDFGDAEVFNINKFDDLYVHLRSIRKHFSSDELDREVKMSLVLYRILVRLSEIKNEQPNERELSKNEKYQKLAPLMEMLSEKYYEDISLGDMADVLGISRNHLCRLFNNVYHTTPLKYLTQLRLNKAKYMLCSPDKMKIKDIAYAVGFNDTSYFCSVFKKMEGSTPEEYRKINNF